MLIKKHPSKISIEIGDELVCMSNEGLWSMGDKKIVWGVSENSINFQPCLTSWQSKDRARLDHYRLVKKKPTKEILAFQLKFQEVSANNKVLLDGVAERLKKSTVEI